VAPQEVHGCGGVCGGGDGGVAGGCCDASVSARASAPASANGTHHGDCQTPRRGSLRQRARAATRVKAASVAEEAPVGRSRVQQTK